MPFPGYTESKTAGSSYAPVAPGSTREHVTVPDWRNDLVAHVATMHANVTQAASLPPVSI